MYSVVWCYLGPFVSSWALQQHTQRIRLRSNIFIQQFSTGDTQLHLRDTVRHLRGDRETIGSEFNAAEKINQQLFWHLSNRYQGKITFVPDSQQWVFVAFLVLCDSKLNLFGFWTLLSDKISNEKMSPWVLQKYDQHLSPFYRENN